MIHDITRHLVSVRQKASCRVLILRGVGKHFSAGADLNWMKEMADYSFEENVNDAKKLYHMLKAVRTCSKPVIAQVQGSAFGGGTGIIAACDFAAGLNHVQLAFTEVKLGLSPATISPFVIEKIGAAKASRYFLTAERFDANRAMRMRLLSEVFESKEEMKAWLQQQIKFILSAGPEAIAEAKKLILQSNGIDFDNMENITAKIIAERRASCEGKEGIQAFLEKRKPSWRRER